MTRKIVVLQSFPVPRPTTNPYLVMLGNSLAEQPGVRVVSFGWLTALAGRFDVFHLHWPEALFDGRNRLTEFAHRIFFLALLVKLRLFGIPVVRTVHNLELPSGISRFDRWLLELAGRQATMLITLNSSTPVPPGRPSVMIPHGHYRPWFSSIAQPESIAGRFGFFGFIRRYKGVEGLISAFCEIPTDPGVDVGLHVAGKPSTQELRASLTALATGDDRIELDLRFVDDTDLVAIAGRSELVVLPYLDMHNSAGALTALSLDRPVLVPDNDVNHRLSDEVGPGWVFTYQGRLTGDVLVGTLEKLRVIERARRPNMDGRNWDSAGADHVRAYREAVSLISEARHTGWRWRTARRRDSAG